VHLEQDLWNVWLLTLVNGRIGTPMGRARALPSPSLEAALLSLAAVAKRRRQRGYHFEPSHVRRLKVQMTSMKVGNYRFEGYRQVPTLEPMCATAMGADRLLRQKAL
jgi:hypothetical protein